MISIVALIIARQSSLKNTHFSTKITTHAHQLADTNAD